MTKQYTEDQIEDEISWLANPHAGEDGAEMLRNLWTSNKKLIARVLELEEESAMYRWLRDHYHGFEHYRTEWAKSQGLFERDLREQISITQEKT